MFSSLFRALTDRFKALFATNAALELESEFLARDAERRADLLRQADRYDTEGLRGIAEHLRLRADKLVIDRPLASTLPALEHLAGNNVAYPLLDAPAALESSDVAKALVPTRRKKKGR